MRLNGEKIEIETEGFETADFSVDVNDPAIIQILTEKIYTDPYIWPREIIANANDAGGAVELTLPEPLSPEWIIEDHGPGMTHEFMVGADGKGGRYTRIFDSTKRDSNDKTGGFGHGRLSPLAYTDSFTVRSRFIHEGQVWEGQYIVFRGPNKIPKLTATSIGISEVQQTGVRVTIPVARADITKINERTKYYAQYAEKLPPGMKAVSYIFKGTTGGSREIARNSYEEHAGIRLVMGGVPYPAPEVYGVPRGVTADLFFEIGELDPTLSRDAINNTAAASDLIKKKWATFVKEFNEFFKTEVDKEVTVLDKYVKFQGLYNKLSYDFQRIITTSSFNPVLQADDVFKATTGDFALHNILSDTDRSIWTGMDETTKTFKSLNALKVFMLTGKGEIQRRDGDKTGVGTSINLKDFIHIDRYKPIASGFDTIMFAVPLPYGQGQIKRIREAIAKIVGEARTKGDLSKYSKIILVQYEHKKDAEAIRDMLSKKIQFHWIDDNSAGAKGTRYIPLSIIAPSGSHTKRAMSPAAIVADASHTIAVRPKDGNERNFYEVVQTFVSQFQNQFTGNILVMSEGDFAKLPKHNLASFHDKALAAIKNSYGGYTYVADDIAKAANAITRTGSSSEKLRYSFAVRPASNKYLDEVLLTLPEIVAIKDLSELLTLSKKVRQDYASNSNNAGYTELRAIQYKANAIAGLINQKILTDKELPTPTKALPSPSTGPNGNAMYEAFLKKYPFYENIRSSYSYGNMPANVFNHLVQYLVKFA